jgi:hypothetical protein
VISNMQNLRHGVTGLAVAGLVAGTTALVCAAPKTAPPRTPAARTPAKSAARTAAKPAVANKPAAGPRDAVEPVYTVVSPLGDPTVKMIPMAPRLNTLAGKKVCMVWNQAFQSHVTLPAIAESLKEKYPDIRIIPYTEIDAAIQAAGRKGAAPQPSGRRPRPGTPFGGRRPIPGRGVPPGPRGPAPAGDASEADGDASAAEAAVLQAVLKEKGCEAIISGNGG